MCMRLASQKKLYLKYSGKRVAFHHALANIIRLHIVKHGYEQTILLHNDPFVCLRYKYLHYHCQFSRDIVVVWKMKCVCL